MMNILDMLETLSLRWSQEKSLHFLHQRLLLPREGTASRHGLLRVWRLMTGQEKNAGHVEIVETVEIVANKLCKQPAQ